MGPTGRHPPRRVSKPRTQQTTPVLPQLGANSEAARALICLGVDLPVGPVTPTPCAMLPSHLTAYLDDEEMQDRGTCMYAHVRTHTHTPTHTREGRLPPGPMR